MSGRRDMAHNDRVAWLPGDRWIHEDPDRGTPALTTREIVDLVAGHLIVAAALLVFIVGLLALGGLLIAIAGWS
jgi:hypothetical protein